MEFMVDFKGVPLCLFVYFKDCSTFTKSENEISREYAISVALPIFQMNLENER